MAQKIPQTPMSPSQSYAGGVRDEPKERLRRRLNVPRLPLSGLQKIFRLHTCRTLYGLEGVYSCYIIKHSEHFHVRYDMYD